MTFAFQPKTESLNWDMMAGADIQRIVENTDIAYLESLLQNISNARLEGTDLRRIGDRNLIKFFKVGQLTLEYLLFLQSQSEFQLSASLRESKLQRQSIAQLEDKVRNKQKLLVSTKANVKVKQQTLKTYESILRQPEGTPIELAKCNECAKFFASNAHLVAHYKRRHPDLYIKEIRAKEDQLLQQEIGEMKVKAEISAQEGEFLRKVREEVMDKYKENFVSLEQQLNSLKNLSQTQQMKQHESSANLSQNVTEAQFAVNQYKTEIDEFKKQMESQLAAQPAQLHKEVQGALQDYLQAQAERDASMRREEDQARLDDLSRQRKESELKVQIKRQVEDDLKFGFDAKIEEMQRNLKAKENQLGELKQQYDQAEVERATKEREMKQMKLQYERQARMQEEKFKKELEAELAAKVAEAKREQTDKVSEMQSRMQEEDGLKLKQLQETREADQKRIAELESQLRSDAEQLRKSQSEELDRQKKAMGELQAKNEALLNEKAQEISRANQELEKLRDQLSETQSEDGKEPYFSSRSGRKKSPATEESKSKLVTPSRNESGLPKQLGTIDEDEGEQQATISPSQLTQTTKGMDEEDSRVPVIPSLNLDHDNLRKKTSEQNARRARQAQSQLKAAEKVQTQTPGTKLATEVKMRNPSPTPSQGSASESPKITSATKIGLKKSIESRP